MDCRKCGSHAIAAGAIIPSGKTNLAKLRAVFGEMPDFGKGLGAVVSQA